MRSQTEIEIPDDLPYQIAVRVLDQGVKCDALAGYIRKTLLGYLAMLDPLAQESSDAFDRDFDKPSVGRGYTLRLED